MSSKYDDYTDEQLAEEAEKYGTMVLEMEEQIQHGYIGQEDVIQKVLLTIVGGGNVLLEGVPGLGKSFLVEQLANTVETDEMNMIQEKMNRIQFTPDLLPGDIMGVEAYNEEKGFYVEKGPIFANFILADEINRAPPKVQSAMLEAMQEHKVSIGDETFDLPEPFFVMATQNPAEQGGSLHPEETLYLNGELMKAKEALELARENGEVAHRDDDKTVYDLDGVFANHLNTDGEVKETEALVYEKDYEGEIYTIESRTGRQITVNATHPVLVNDSGDLVWKKARELKPNDFLVQPEEVDLPENSFAKHKEVLQCLEDNFAVIHEEDIVIAKDNIRENNFTCKEIDILRIGSGLSKKELSELAGVSYNRVQGYLNGADNGLGSVLANSLDLESIPESSFIESHKIHEVKEDAWSNAEAGFFLGFTLAEGHIENDRSIEVSQKNYPELLERWIELAENKGLEVNIREKEDVKHAKIRSKPFVKYLNERYNLNNPSKLLSAPREFKEEFIDSFMMAETYYEADNKEDNYRITLTQQDKEITETINYMLIDYGIRPRIYDEDDKYRVRISDKSLKKYLERFTWPGSDEPEISHDSSSYRVLPVDTEMINTAVENLGFKNCGNMEDKDWYPAYHMSKKRGRISEYELKKFTEAMRTRIDELESREFNSTQEKALSFGIGMTEIVEETNLTKHRVWQTYKDDSRNEAAEQYIEREKEIKIEKTKNILNYLEKLVSQEVFYDPIQKIEKEENYEGKVIGLTVPETHNYIAGNAATGINHNTYPLPEAQKDRFMFKIYLDYPKKVNERKIIDMNANIMDDADFGVEAVVSQQDIRDMQEFSKHVKVSEEVKAYIVDLVDATRNPAEYGLEYEEYIEWGCTPRASINLALAGRAHAIYDKRHYVTPEDIRAVLEDVFIHRIMLNYEGEAKGIDVREIIDDIIDHVPVR